MSNVDVQQLIDRIMSDERFRSSSHFSDKVYEDAPILRTGRQMTNYLPDEYHQMRAISRWQQNEGGEKGRWLSEAELFYRQAAFMADFEDNCPYHGSFASLYPTYNAMSDRQLRGYFTWRAAVRHGVVEETCPAFAHVYLYELLCGVGSDGARDGFEKMHAFWQAYRAYDQGLDHYARTWLQDYVVYHGLPAQLLNDQKTMQFDRSLVNLRAATEQAQAVCSAGVAATKKRGRTAAALPLPPNEQLEEQLFCALDELSTHPIASSALMEQHALDLRHVSCNVYLRLVEHYAANRKSSLLDTFFGAPTAMPYTMFASAVFFEPAKHADTEYRLNDIHFYTCKHGFWECTRVHGNRGRSPKLGQILRAVDQRLREALDFDQKLSDEESVPKYLAAIIDKEIDTWLTWKQAHAPRHIDIDLSSLAQIRATAADTREALLIDEERTGVAPVEPSLEHANTPCRGDTPSECELHTSRRALDVPSERAGLPDQTGKAPSQQDGPASKGAPPLSDQQAVYLAALLALDSAGATAVAASSGASEDMLVDAINEALFDMVGDTVIEFGAGGPQVIEDYEDDVRGLLSDE